MVDYTNEHRIAFPDVGDDVLPATRDFRQAAFTADAAITTVRGQLRSEIQAAAREVDIRRGTLPSGDLNDLVAAADSGIWHLSSSNTYENSPVTAGALIVNSSGFAGTQTISENSSQTIYTRALTSYSQRRWSPWQITGLTDYPSGSPLEDIRTPGEYLINNGSSAAAIPDWPTDVLPARASIVSVTSSTGGLLRQEIRPLYAENRLLTRVTESLGTTPFPFTPWKDISQTSQDQVNANELLLQDFTRRHGGVRFTGGKGVVSFRFDHGLRNFQDKVLPLTRAAGIRVSQALNSRNWHYDENQGITAETVNGWVEDGDVEIWNHGATHNNATTLERLELEIITGLQELRDQIPAADIDGFVPPGVGAPDPYMGFNAGSDARKFFETEAGKMILAHHAVSTGTITDTHQYVLDGVIRQGQSRFFMDSRTVETITAEIDYAIANKTGLQLALHPSMLDSEGQMTTAQFEQILDYVLGKQADGELMLVSPYEMFVVDSRL